MCPGDAVRLEILEAGRRAIKGEAAPEVVVGDRCSVEILGCSAEWAEGRDSDLTRLSGRITKEEQSVSHSGITSRIIEELSPQYDFLEKP